MSCLISDVSSLISTAGSSNIDVRLASWLSRCSFSAVVVIPALMRLAREMNSDLCAVLPGGWMPAAQVQCSATCDQPAQKKQQCTTKPHLHSPEHPTCSRRPAAQNRNSTPACLHSYCLTSRAARTPTSLASLSANALNSAVLSLQLWPPNARIVHKPAVPEYLHSCGLARVREAEQDGD